MLPGEKRNGMSIKMVGVASNGNYVIEYWEKDGVSGGYVREILTRAEAEKRDSQRLTPPCAVEGQQRPQPYLPRGHC